MVAIPSTVTSLTELAGEVLDVATACLDETTAGAPDLRYISPALPAYDCCPALIVAVAAITEEVTSPLGPMDTGQRSRFGRVNLVAFTVAALRCAPSMDPNGNVVVSEITAAATEVQEDAWALWNGFYHAIQNGEFEGKCSDVHFDRGIAITEQGGCVGWSFQFRALLDGIPNPGV